MTQAFGPCGVVTLTTDFGSRDPYVGAVKGVLLSHAPGARIADISHEVPAFDVAAGAYCLAQAAPFFPRGTVHVAVVDPGVGGARRCLVVCTARALYIAPDNGLLCAALAIDPPREILATDAAGHGAAPTFHGRDLFAVLAGRALARRPLGHALRRIDRIAPLCTGDRAGLARPERQRGERSRAAAGSQARRAGPTQARVLWIDRFGNLVTDLRRETAGHLPANIHGRIGRRTIQGLRRTYEGGPRGTPFFLWGSGGFLEISVDQGSAARLTGARVGSRVRVGASQ